jgi:mRNA interferase RelE/StbE
MEIKFELDYHELVKKNDIPKIPENIKKRIKSAIEYRLTLEPEVFGKPLRKSLKGYRKLRVGDYRVIFRIEGKRVKIFIIQHRSVVYKNAEMRIVY